MQAGSVNVFAESKYYYSDCSLHYTEQDIEKVYFYSINFHLVSTELADAIITLRTLVSNDVTKVCGGSLSVFFINNSKFYAECYPHIYTFGYL